MKCNQSRPGFELVSPCPFPKTITTTPRAPRFMQDGRKTVWSILYVSFALFSSLKQNFIAYRSSKVSSHPDCIFEIHQLWQSGFSRMYSNCCCSCSFEAEIIKIGRSSHKMHSNNILNFQESTTILNGCTKKSGILLKAPRKTILSFLYGIVNIFFANNLRLAIGGNLIYWFPLHVLMFNQLFQVTIQMVLWKKKSIERKSDKYYW